MDGVIWLFLALAFALIALAMALAGVRRRAPLTHQQFESCTRCLTPMSMRRLSLFGLLAHRAMWMCPHCGARMSKPGRRTGTTA